MELLTTVINTTNDIIYSTGIIKVRCGGRMTPSAYQVGSLSS